MVALASSDTGARGLLGELLVEKGLISAQTLAVALKEQAITKRRLGSVLVANGFLLQKDLLDVLREHDMSQIAYESTLISRSPPETLIATRTMILYEDRDAVFLSTLSDEEEVEFLLQRHYPGMKMIFYKAIVDSIEEYLAKLEVMINKDEGLADKLVRDALVSNASDIHIEPRRETYTVWFRSDGVRSHYHEGDLVEYGRLVTNIKMRANIDISNKQIPHDGGYQVDHNSKMVDLRVATLPSISGEKITIRLLDPDSTKPSLDGLGISNVDDWRKGVSAPSGLCLICGPTGSGKTTTLNATARGMNRYEKAINTLEDPVEYQIPHVTQSNVNPGSGFDFAKGVRALLRNDIDVGIVGEIRDLETAEQAVRAAETGHLVIGTLHTDSISGSFDRLRDIGVNPKELQQIVRSVLVQRLVRTLCGVCAGEGCRLCNHTGYRGRSIVSEVVYFKNEKEVGEAIEGKRWWTSMVDDAVHKFEDGMTTAEEIVRVFGEKGREALTRAGHHAPELAL